MQRNDVSLVCIRPFDLETFLRVAVAAPTVLASVRAPRNAHPAADSQNQECKQVHEEGEPQLGAEGAHDRVQGSGSGQVEGQRRVGDEVDEVERDTGD